MWNTDTSSVKQDAMRVGSSNDGILVRCTIESVLPRMDRTKLRILLGFFKLRPLDNEPQDTTLHSIFDCSSILEWALSFSPKYEISFIEDELLKIILKERPDLASYLCLMPISNSSSACSCFFYDVEFLLILFIFENCILGKKTKTISSPASSSSDQSVVDAFCWPSDKSYSLAVRYALVVNPNFLRQHCPLVVAAVERNLLKCRDFIESWETRQGQPFRLQFEQFDRWQQHSSSISRFGPINVAVQVSLSKSIEYKCNKKYWRRVASGDDINGIPAIKKVLCMPYFDIAAWPSPTEIALISEGRRPPSTLHEYAVQDILFLNGLASPPSTSSSLFEISLNNQKVYGGAELRWEFEDVLHNKTVSWLMSGEEPPVWLDSYSWSNLIISLSELRQRELNIELYCGIYNIDGKKKIIYVIKVAGSMINGVRPLNDTGYIEIKNSQNLLTVAWTVVEKELFLFN